MIYEKLHSKNKDIYLKVIKNECSWILLSSFRNRTRWKSHARFWMKEKVRNHFFNSDSPRSLKSFYKNINIISSNVQKFGLYFRLVHFKFMGDFHPILDFLEISTVIPILDFGTSVDINILIKYTRTYKNRICIIIEENNSIII